MKIKEVKRDGTSMTVGLEGRMDAMTSPEFNNRLDGWIGEGVTDFFIDCSQLDYISSAGLRAMLLVAKELKGRGGDLQLASLQETVHTVFTISGFDKIISIVESFDDAVK
jgi:anti-anti-sigma factor